MINKDSLLQPYLKTLTLLCVDRSPVIQMVYEGLFTILFKEVLFATTPEDAIEIYERKLVDLIITDQVFETISGITMIKEMRRKNKSTPIILASEFEDVNLLTEALQQHVHNFVKKPFETTELLDAVENAVKELLANYFLEIKQKEEINKLKTKVDYSDYQETLSFQKELRIARNDFYYKHLPQTSNSEMTIIDFLYKSKDVLSGDLFTTRVIHKNIVLLFLVDGMGKGISASLSAITATAFINRIIDNLIETKKQINFKKIISKFISSTQKILFDEEILSVSLILYDIENQYLDYALFSMPPLLLMDNNDEVLSLKSNNPAINIYVNDFKVDRISCKEIKKLLIYSDGLVENSVKDNDSTYSQYIQEDFKQAITREDLRQRIAQKIRDQEDDITFIFLHTISLKNKITSWLVDSRLSDVEKTCGLFEKLMPELCNDPAKEQALNLAFNELLLNSYEHGNLNLQSKQKHTLIKNDVYFKYLHYKELTCNKKIKVDVYSFSNLEKQNFLLVTMEDGGKGFDTALLATIFGVNKSFNCRGILMSRNSSLGIYYNDAANRVTFIAKL